MCDYSLFRPANQNQTDALKALCVIPRSPSPVPLEDRPREELSREELLELLRCQEVGCSHFDLWTLLISVIGEGLHLYQARAETRARR